MSVELLEPLEGPDLDRARRAFRLYATGAWSDTALADELGLTEAGLAEILTNPLYAGRAVRHKGRPDEEERPARFSAPVEPSLFDRVQTIRERRRTSHSAGGGGYARRSYPLVRLMRCVGLRERLPRRRRRTVAAGSVTAGDPPAARRPRIRPSRTSRRSRACSTACASTSPISGRCSVPYAEPSRHSLRLTRNRIEAARTDLQRRLSAGSISLETFGREWRRLGRPNLAPAPLAGRAATTQGPGAAGGLRRRSGGTLPCPDRLREEALHEIFARFDVRGPGA